MFLGTFHLKLDDKGRLTIPVRYREILQEKYHAGQEPNGAELILSFFDHCLIAYPKAEWMSLAHELTAAITMPSMHREVRDLKRLFFGNAVECTADAQGRVLLAPVLRAKADLNGDITLVGVNDHFEIWNREQWERYYINVEERLEEIAQKLAELSNARISHREHMFGDGSPPRL